MKTVVKRNQHPVSGLFNHFFDNNVFDFPAKVNSGFSTPAVNVKETKEAFELTLAAPGYQKGDFKIWVENDVLSIKVEKQEESQEKEDGRYTRKEFSYSSFQRNFKLPENVQEENIDAAYTDGILKLTLTKAEKQQPESKWIEIK